MLALLFHYGLTPPPPLYPPPPPSTRSTPNEAERCTSSSHGEDVPRSPDPRRHSGHHAEGSHFIKPAHAAPRRAERQAPKSPKRKLMSNFLIPELGENEKPGGCSNSSAQSGAARQQRACLAVSLGTADAVTNINMEMSPPHPSGPHGWCSTGGAPRVALHGVAITLHIS